MQKPTQEKQGGQDMWSHKTVSSPDACFECDGVGYVFKTKHPDDRGHECPRCRGYGKL